MTPTRPISEFAGVARACSSPERFEAGRPDVRLGDADAVMQLAGSCRCFFPTSPLLNAVAIANIASLISVFDCTDLKQTLSDTVVTLNRRELGCATSSDRNAFNRPGTSRVLPTGVKQR